MQARQPARVVKTTPSSRMGAKEGEGGFQFGSSGGKKMKVVPQILKKHAIGDSLNRSGLEADHGSLDELSSSLSETLNKTLDSVQTARGDIIEEGQIFLPPSPTSLIQATSPNGSDGSIALSSDEDMTEGGAPSVPRTIASSAPKITENLIRAPEVEGEAAIPKHTMGTPSRWASLLKNPNVKADGINKLGFISPAIVNGETVINLASRNFSDQTKRCERFVVGSFVGKRPSYMFLKKSLEKIWNTKGDFEMLPHGDSLLFFRFLLEEDRARVLELGHIHVASRLCLIRPWRPYIEQEISAQHTMPIWVNLHNLPTQFWTEVGISSVASGIGVPIMVDSLTSSFKRVDCVRACVEVEVSSSFPEELKICIDGLKIIKVKVEYSWKPLRCSHCKIFRHTDASCNKQPKMKKATAREKQKWVQKSSNADDANATEVIVDDDGSGWKLVSNGRGKQRIVPSETLKADSLSTVLEGRPSSSNYVKQRSVDKTLNDRSISVLDAGFLEDGSCSLSTMNRFCALDEEVGVSTDKSKEITQYTGSTRVQKQSSGAVSSSNDEQMLDSPDVNASFTHVKQRMEILEDRQIILAPQSTLNLARGVVPVSKGFG